MVRRQDEEWAVFWCSILHPVLFGDVDPADRQRILKALAQEERLFPNGVRRKASLSTLQRKLKQYRESGFEGLARKRRSDRGVSRAHDQDTINLAIDIKRDLPTRSDETINKFLKALRSTSIPKSTLYRLLKQAGATRIKLGDDDQPVRRRWTRDRTHALWVGDFEEGPFVVHEGLVVRTHLSAWIDCHSRFLVEGRYYFRQNLDVLIDSLLRAWAAHGASSQLYVDNAKVYHAKSLKTACYRLKIQPLHRKAGDPPGGGLIERFFETAQSQFEAEVRAGDIMTLDRLNEAFSAWLAVSYHQRPNDETKQTPQERYEQGLTGIRHVNLDAAVESFLSRERRRVYRDFSDVRLHGHFYRVDKRLRGDKVEVRYDPFSLSETVMIYSLDDEYLGEGTLHDRSEGEPAGPASAGKAKPKYDYIALLVSQHKDQLAKNARGIDYRQVVRQRLWPFTDFAKTLAQLLGRKGDLTALSAGDLETLYNFHVRHPTLDKTMLATACKKAPDKTVPCILYELQKLAKKKEN